MLLEVLSLAFMMLSVTTVVLEQTFTHLWNPLFPCQLYGDQIIRRVNDC